MLPMDLDVSRHDTCLQASNFWTMKGEGLQPSFCRAPQYPDVRAPFEMLYALRHDPRTSRPHGGICIAGMQWAEKFADTIVEIIDVATLSQTNSEPMVLSTSG